MGNRAALQAAFESVLFQTRRPDVLRVVYDCDDPAVVKEWCDVDHATSLGIDVRLVPARAVLGARAGGSAARNAGLAALDTAFVAYLDDDDLWLPRHLELLERAAIADPGAIAYTRSVRLQGEGSVVVWPPNNSYVGEIGLATTLHTYPANHTSALFPRSVLEWAGGYDTALAREEDVDLLIRVGTRCRFRLVDEVTHVIFRHPGQAQTPQVSIAARRTLLDKHSERMTSRERADAWHHLALSAWRLGCTDEAVNVLREHTIRAARLAPTAVLRRYLALRTNRTVVGGVKRALRR
jgi:hypothetical protein